MSIGNLKDQGNKGNNFPYQLSALKLAGKELVSSLKEYDVSAATPVALSTAVNLFLSTHLNEYLVSKSVVYNSASNTYIAFITLAKID